MVVMHIVTIIMSTFKIRIVIFVEFHVTIISSEAAKTFKLYY
jgi:hypothetical protein